jgi:dihydroorotase-like cyclic amidohydrolase
VVGDLLIKDGLIIHADGERQEDIRISDEQFTVVESNVSPEEG